MNIGVTKIDSKEVILIKITALMWLIAKIISWKLWLSDRLFPVIPLFEFSSNFSNQVHLSLYILSIITLILVFLFTKNKYFLILVVFSEIASCMLDQMRWQPWEFQYLLMFIFFIFYKKQSNQFIQFLTFFIAVTYIYSGLHKFNGGFLYNIWEHRILKNFLHFPNEIISKTWVHYSGLLLAVFETSLGLGLLFLKDKRIVIALAIAMHIFILVFLIVGNINPVVWPWNITFILFLSILFLDKNATQIDVNFLKNKYNWIVILLIGVMPIFSFFGLWNNFLSFNLYSGNVKHLIICVKSVDKQPALKPFLSSHKNVVYCSNQFFIDTNLWSFEELNVPLCPDEELFLKFKQQFEKLYSNPENHFIVYQYPYKKENFRVIH